MVNVSLTLEKKKNVISAFKSVVSSYTGSCEKQFQWFVGLLMSRISQLGIYQQYIINIINIYLSVQIEYC